MPWLAEDSIDFQTWMRQTEAKAKVHRASAFAEDLEAEFAERPASHRSAMISTKLRSLIEFRPGEVTAWAGYNGHRKSMFVGQLALDLCVQRQPVLIASLEMPPARTLKRMVLQASGTGTPGKSLRAEFLKWTGDRLWMFDHLGRIKPEQMVGVCNYFAGELKGRHVFIDSMMMVVGSEESMDEQKQFVTDLCRLAQETGLHVHLVVHARKPQTGEDKPPGKYDVRGSSAITDQVANVITVWTNKPKLEKLEKNPHDPIALADPDALVSVEKQRNGAWEGRVKLWFHEPSMRFLDDRTMPCEPYAMRAEQ